MEEEKQKIRPKIVVEEGENIPSVDSIPATSEMSETQSPVTPEALEPEEVQPVTPPEPTSTILAEETKDASNDIKIVEPPQPIDKKSNKLTGVLIALISLVIIGLLAGGIYVYIKGTSEESGVVTTLPSPTPLAIDEPSATPAPTPSEKIDVSSLKVSILNGSGKIGEAGKVKTLIEKEGFKVANTGNAATFNFAETVIQAKEGTAQVVIDQLEDVLSTNYEIKIGDSLKDTSTYDIVITVGSK